MEKNIDWLEKFDALNKGLLSESEKQELEATMSNDKELMELFEKAQMVDQIVIASEALKLKAQMKKDLARPKNNFYLGLAGSLILLSSAGLVYFLNQPAQEKLTKAEQLTEIQLNDTLSEKSISNIEEKTVEKAVQHKETLTLAHNLAEKETLNPISEKESIQQPTETANVVELGQEKITLKEPKENSPISSASTKSNTKPTDWCADFRAEVLFETFPSCRGAASGEVLIKTETQKLGKAPFVFWVNGVSSQSKISGLAPNEYILKVTDANGCSAESGKKVVIGEKTCSAKKDFVFNVNYDATWQITCRQGLKPSTLHISDANGRMVFQKTLEKSEETVEWNGDSNTGQNVNSGNYFYVLSYADGSIDQGLITLVK